MGLPSGLKKQGSGNKMKGFFGTNLTLIIAKDHEDSPASSHKKALGLTNLASSLLHKTLGRHKPCQNKSPLKNHVART